LLNSLTIIVVNFLHKIDPNAFNDIMKKIVLVVIPSIWPEPLPYVLIESMLYGKLIIASNIGGIPEVIGGANLGVKLFEPGNIEELAKSLELFLSLELREAVEIGIKNREYISKKFDNKKIVKSFIKS